MQKRFLSSILHGLIVILLIGCSATPTQTLSTPISVIPVLATSTTVSLPDPTITIVESGHSWSISQPGSNLIVLEITCDALKGCLDLHDVKENIHYYKSLELIFADKTVWSYTCEKNKPCKEIP